jgi:hypothetical protein
MSLKMFSGGATVDAPKNVEQYVNEEIICPTGRLVRLSQMGTITDLPAGSNLMILLDNELWYIVMPLTTAQEEAHIHNAQFATDYNEGMHG